jgi:hypothetical protein
MSYIGKQPSPAVLTASDITDGIVSNAKLAQDIISADTALGAEPADTDEFLVSDAGTLKRMDYSYIKGGVNTPCFFSSYTGSGVTINDNTWTKVQFSTEVFDVGGVYDHSTNYRYTPGFVGKSFISTGLWFYSVNVKMNDVQIAFYKNGSTASIFQTNFPANVQRHFMTANWIVDHDADDYYEVYQSSDTSDSSTVESPSSSVSSTNWRNWFSGFKIIT